MTHNRRRKKSPPPPLLLLVQQTIGREDLLIAHSLSHTIYFFPLPPLLLASESNELIGMKPGLGTWDLGVSHF